jgi:tetratricopeptide (TPR) repeat protein
MAFNKSKHIDAAQKYLNQGKLPQAIAEYQQILKHEPKDQVTLMTLGDLFVRQGETFQGLEYFERLAKIFLNDGFTTKAIAIYKKVAKLAPEESRPLERLAELYVQQGVLSEARPLFLQLAEVHLRAGRQGQAAELFSKLLEIEPDNLRVQMRLAELQLAMGQHKEAIGTFHHAVQRALDRGDHAEAIRLADRTLNIEPQHFPTLVLKARALSGAGKRDEATALLESLPEPGVAEEPTALLLELYVERGQPEKAAALAEKMVAQDPKNYGPAHHVASMLLDAGDLDRAHHLLAQIRNAMMDSGDHEILAQTLSRLAELRPGHMEPLEWLVDLYGRASDSFRLPDALAQLAAALEAAGQNERALETYEQLLDRNPEDESTRRQCAHLREKMGLEPVADGAAPPVKQESRPEQAPDPSTPTPDPDLDEETKRYAAQALTDVDLFSSYGLRDKAIELLETVLLRAPRHRPALERLLDLSVGASNDRRTAELASLLEQIAIERNDLAGTDRYGELRRRYQRAARMSKADLSAATQISATDAPEFEIPTIDAQLAEPVQPPVDQAPPEPAPEQAPSAPVPMEPIVHEVDLSEEWAALSQQLEQAIQDAAAAEGLVAQSPPSPAPEVLPEATPEAAEAEGPVFDLELQPADPTGPAAAKTTSDQAAPERLSTGSVPGAPAPVGFPADLSSAGPPADQHATPRAPTPTNGSVAPPDTESVGLPGPLGDLFEVFRSELGETDQEDEDLETHYNLGIAYREMGLLEEAISEFQKVAKAGEKGPAFRYAMQCCTLLGLCFMEKGQPSISAMWYERALAIPGLEQESILALRYDLGVAQELAGETESAFRSFSQVYAMNIDYRDVAERIAMLGKAR